MTDEEALAQEAAAGWKYVPTEGVYVNPRLTTDLTQAAKSLRVALMPVEVLPVDNAHFSGLLFSMLSALTAQRALLAQVFPDMDFEVYRWVPEDLGRRHRAAWRPAAATKEQYNRWLEQIRPW